MPRELIILRHCKSDWDGNIHQDELRPLSRRGIRNAEALGVWMKSQSIIPERVYCSTAVRARQTLELVNDGLQLAVDKIQFHKDLYLASLATLLEYLAEVDVSCRSLMLIGHNPGLDYLIEHISIKRPPLTSSGKLMTTGCLVHFSCPEEWQTLKQTGELLSITRPADISTLPEQRS